MFMKKTIIISGIAVANLMMFGSVFKVMHWPGANILLCIATFLFAFWFLPSALVSSYRSQPAAGYKWLHIVTYFVFLFISTGALFKIMHWPGAALLMLISVPAPFVLFLPVYLYQTRKDKQYTVANLMSIMFGLVVLAVLTAMLSLNVSRQMLVDLQDHLLKTEELIDTDVQTTGNTPLAQKADEACKYIDLLRCNLLEITANRCPVETSGNLRLTQPFLQSPDAEVVWYLYDDTEGQTKMQKLMDVLVQFGNMVTNDTTLAEEVKLYAGKRLPAEITGEPWATEWEKNEFPTGHLSAVLLSLTRLKADVRFIEKNAVN